MTLYTIEIRWGIRICFLVTIPTLYSCIEEVMKPMFKLHVQCLNQCSKYYKVPLVSRPYKPARNIPRIFADRALNVAIFGISRAHSGKIFKEIIFVTNS